MKKHDIIQLVVVGVAIAIMVFAICYKTHGADVGRTGTSNYPDNIDTNLTPFTTDDVVSEVIVNGILDAIIKVQTELDTVPKDGYASVKERLDAIGTYSANGYLVNSLVWPNASLNNCYLNTTGTPVPMWHLNEINNAIIGSLTASPATSILPLDIYADRSRHFIIRMLDNTQLDSWKNILFMVNGYTALINHTSSYTDGWQVVRGSMTVKKQLQALENTKLAIAITINQSIPHNTDTTVTFDRLVNGSIDVNSEFNLVTYKFIPKYKGTYLMTVQINGNASIGSYYTVTIYHGNGSKNFGNEYCVNISQAVNMEVGDECYIVVKQQCGLSKSIYQYDAPEHCVWTISRIP